MAQQISDDALVFISDKFYPNLGQNDGEIEKDGVKYVLYKSSNIKERIDINITKIKKYSELKQGSIISVPPVFSLPPNISENPLTIKMATPTEPATATEPVPKTVSETPTETVIATTTESATGKEEQTTEPPKTGGKRKPKHAMKKASPKSKKVNKTLWKKKK